MLRRRGNAAIPLALGLLVACSTRLVQPDAGTPSPDAGGDAGQLGPSSDAGFVASATIGPDGGSLAVASSENEAIAGTSIQVPAGALPRVVQITVAPSDQSVIPPGALAAGPVVAFGPSGTTFALPVTVQIPVVLPRGASIAQLVVEAVEATGASQEIPVQSVQGGLASFQVSGFTLFGCVVTSCGADTACQASDGTPFCADTQTDPGNCGACNSACPSGDVCVNAACNQSCGSGGGFVLCTDVSGTQSCVDLQTDFSNCSACNHVCNAGSSCVGGTCRESCGEDTLCTDTNGSSYCANLQSDRLNCGGCGSTCPVADVCAGGGCYPACGGSALLCPGAAGSEQCVDPQTDPGNCGGCGVGCPGGSACVGGACHSSTDGGTPVVGPTSTVEGVALLFDQTDSSGTVVTVVGTDASATTAADGSYSISNVPVGTVSLHFSNGYYQTVLENVIVGLGMTGEILDDGMYCTLSEYPMFLTKGTMLVGNAALPFSAQETEGTPFASPAGTAVFLDYYNYYDLTGGGSALLFAGLFPLDGSPPTPLPAGSIGCPVFSLDGTQFSYLLTPPPGGGSALVTVPINGGAATTLEGDFGGIDCDPGSYAFATNAGVAFSSANGMLVTTADNMEVTLSDNASGAWSPTGAEILFTSAGALLSVPATGGTPVTLAPDTTSCSLTSDNQFVVCPQQSGIIYSVAVDGGGQTPLCTGLPVGTTVDSIVWLASPSVIVQATSGSATPLYACPEAGGPAAAIGGNAGSASPYPLAVSPDNSHICFAVPTGDLSAIWCAPVGGGDAVEIGTTDSNVVISTDSQFVAWTNGGTVMSALIAGGTASTVYSGTDVGITLTPVDGSWILILPNQNAGFASGAQESIDLATGTSFVFETTGKSGSAALSPDLTQLLYTDDATGFPVTQNIAGGAAVTVTNMPLAGSTCSSGNCSPPEAFWAPPSTLIYSTTGIQPPYDYDNGVYFLITQ